MEKTLWELHCKLVQWGRFWNGDCEHLAPKSSATFVAMKRLGYIPEFSESVRCVANLTREDIKRLDSAWDLLPRNGFERRFIQQFYIERKRKKTVLNMKTKEFKALRERVLYAVDNALKKLDN